MTLLRKSFYSLTACLALQAVSAAGAAPRPLRFTVDVEADSLDYPFVSPSENRAALEGMLGQTTAVGHYLGSTTHLALARCMIGVTCYPSPHLESGTKDYPVTVATDMTRSSDGRYWQLSFSLPADHQGKPIAGVTLSVPLKALWRQPTMKVAMQRAATALPGYEQYADAQREDGRQSIVLAVPQETGKPGPLTYYCIRLSNPRSLSGSGIVRMRVTLDNAGSAMPPEAYHSDQTDAGTPCRESPSPPTNADSYYMPEAEKAYLWRADR